MERPPLGAAFLFALGPRACQKVRTVIPPSRHGRACPGHPDWKCPRVIDRDHRHKAGDDERGEHTSGSASFYAPSSLPVRLAVVPATLAIRIPCVTKRTATRANITPSEGALARTTAPVSGSITSAITSPSFTFA